MNLGIDFILCHMLHKRCVLRVRGCMLERVFLYIYEGTCTCIFNRLFLIYDNIIILDLLIRLYQ